MQVLGIDPSSIRCGYGIIAANDNGRAIDYIECGVLYANPRHDKWARICTIANDLRAVAAEHKWGLDDVCGIESAYIPPERSHGVETLAEARGAYVYVAMCCGLSVLTVPPSTVKKVVTGRGHADKAAVAETVRMLLGLKRAPEPDAADALGVALAVARGAGK